jgi:hypothetical protein
MSDPFVRLSRRIVDEVEKITLAVKRVEGVRPAVISVGSGQSLNMAFRKTFNA